MKNDNKANSTINFTRKALTFLSKHTSLSEPEAVKHFIAQMEANNGHKKNLCISYNQYCKYYKIEWKMPIYKAEEKDITPPKKDKILMLRTTQRVFLQQKPFKHNQQENCGEKME
jgi:hypothetical protein